MRTRLAALGAALAMALCGLSLAVAPRQALAQPAGAAEPGCRPEVAMNGARFMRAALKPDSVRLSFIGHATFLIETPQGITVATDYNDYVRPSAAPVVATMNKAHSTHYSLRPDPAIKHVLRGWEPGGGKATHNLTVADLRIRNVSTNIRTWGGTTEYDGNSIFVFEVGDLCIAHLGHLHHPLETDHIRALGRIDVVLVPVDGNYTLDMDGMFEVLTKLQPRLMIPMHYFGPPTLERFIARAAQQWSVERKDSPVLVVSRESLPAAPTVVVLPGR